VDLKGSPTACSTDGRSESISDGPCLCDPDNRDCDIHSRLSVLLADLPGLGVWRIDTSGYYAAVELQGAVEIIQIAAGRGQMLPARLRLEQRVVKRPGEDGKPVTRRFAVPVLDIEISPGQLLGGARPALAASEPTRVDNTAALALPTPPPLTPVPSSVPTHPVQSIPEQMQQQPKGKPRANAAQPITPTGLEPRKAADAARDAPVAPEPEFTPSGLDEFAPVELITPGQSARMHAAFNGLGITKDERGERLAITAQAIGRDVKSSTELTKDEATKLINHLETMAQPLPDEPPLEGA
jgi:hypothetical protein